MGCVRRVCTRRTRAYLLEWLLTLSVIVVPLACAVFLIPFRNRAISLLDSTIQQPYYDKDSLPILSVFIPSVVLPLLCFSLYPFALSRWPRLFGMPPHPFSFHYTYWWSSCLVQAVGLTVLLSELSKRLVQYPRPDFLHRCFPDGVPDAVMTAARNSNYIINTNLCTPPSMAVFEDGLQSFPSEHTSLSWCMAIVLLLFFKTLRRELVSQQMRMSRIMRCRARSARLKNAAAAAAAAPGVDPAVAAALAASGDHHDHSHAFRARLLAATRHALHKVHIPMPIPSPSPELRPPTLMGALPVTCLDESATPLDPDLDSSEMAATDDIEAAQDLPNGVNQELESDPDQAAGADPDADGEAEAVENGTAASAAAAAAPSATAAPVPGLAAGHSGSGRSVHGRSGSGRSVNGRSGSGRSVHGRSGSGRSVHRRSASGRVLDIPENPPVYMSPFWPNSHLVCIIHGLLPVGWAVAVSLSRAFDHKHNVGDIIGGAFVGIGVAFAVYRMHLIKFQGYHRRWTEGDGDADQSDSESDSESDEEQAERTLIRKDGQQQDTEAGRGDAAAAGTAAATRAGMGMQPGNGGSVNGGDQREQQQLLHPFAIRATTEGDSGRNSTGSTGGVSRSWPPIDPKDGDAQLGPSAKHDRTSKERQSSGEPLAPDMHESAFPRQDYEDRERDQRLDLAGALIRPAAPSQPLAISHPVALPPGLQHYPSAAAGTGACSCAPAQLQHAHSNGAAAPRSM